MYTYTLCDLDNNQTRCYSDCRYDSSPYDHAHNYVTSAWSSIDENYTTSGNENANVGDGVYWQVRDTDLIAAIPTSGHCPLDVTYYCQCPGPNYKYADDDSVLVENVANCTYKNWKSGCRTFCSDNVDYTGSWGSYDDVILDSRCDARHLSMYDETNMEYMDMLRRHPPWNHSQVAISEDRPGTANQCAVSARNEHTGTETFKWMTVKRGSSKYLHTGTLTLCTPLHIN